jgi:hypothetical protein
MLAGDFFRDTRAMPTCFWCRCDKSKPSKAVHAEWCPRFDGDQRRELEIKVATETLQRKAGAPSARAMATAIVDALRDLS